MKYPLECLRTTLFPFPKKLLCSSTQEFYILTIYTPQDSVPTVDLDTDSMLVISWPDRTRQPPPKATTPTTILHPPSPHSPSLTIMSPAPTLVTYHTFVTITLTKTKTDVSIDMPNNGTSNTTDTPSNSRPGPSSALWVLVVVIPLIVFLLWFDCLKSKCYPWERRKPEGQYANDSSEGSSQTTSSPTGSEGPQIPEYRSILRTSRRNSLESRANYSPSGRSVQWLDVAPAGGCGVLPHQSLTSIPEMEEPKQPSPALIRVSVNNQSLDLDELNSMTDYNPEGQ